MGLVSQALMLIDSVMTMVLTHGSLHEQGTFLLFKAKCKIYQSQQVYADEKLSPVSNILGKKYKHKANSFKLIILTKK